MAKLNTESILLQIATKHWAGWKQLLKDVEQEQKQADTGGGEAGV